MKKNNKNQEIKLPYSISAEQCILGAIMLENDHWEHIELILSESDFYLPSHRFIFKHISKLMAQKKPADLITVAESIEAEKALDFVGGFAYLAELSKNTPRAANVRWYAECVSSHCKSRQLIELSQNIIEQAQSSQDIPLIIEEAEQCLFSISQKNTTLDNVDVDLNNAFTQFLEGLENRLSSTTGITGTPSGINNLDNMTCGFQPSDFILLAGRPSMGKTALALAFCVNALQSSASSVQFYSLEMSTNQILMRLTAMLGRIDLHRLRSGQMSDDDLNKLAIIAGKILAWNHQFILDDTSDMTPTKLRSKVRRNVRKYGKPSLILIDYLQLMHCAGFENRTQEISKISRSIKALAKEIDVPIIALSQLNRGLEQRTDKRPINGDLRDSGALEQDADIIMFVYRDEIYNINSDLKGTADIIIGKQRNGAIGSIRVKYQSNITLFENIGDE